MNGVRSMVDRLFISDSFYYHFSTTTLFMGANVVLRGSGGGAPAFK